MKSSDKERLRWELQRERFQIEDPFPPKTRLRQERPLGKILAELVTKEIKTPEQLPTELIERWPLIAGHQLAQHIRPAHLQEGILYLYADHPGWLNEARRLPQGHLLKKIATVPGAPNITDLRFQLDPDMRPGK